MNIITQRVRVAASPLPLLRIVARELDRREPGLPGWRGHHAPTGHESEECAVVTISDVKAPAPLDYGRIPNLVELEDLIAVQTGSFRWFLTEGLRELFDEISPISDYSGKNFELRFLDFEWGEPKFTVEECRNRDMTYAAPLRIRTRP